jgi:uncharacterized pyridoxamine 5'-phosphate oxidase family protein
MPEELKIQDMSNNSQGYRPNKKEVFDFLDSQMLGEVATLDQSGQPQVATVAFSQTDDLKIIIGTDENSRKSQNIENDSRVAFVATDPAQRYTVQLDGKAKRLTTQEFDEYAEAHFEKLPASAPFRDVKGQCYFLITPHWLRFSDCNSYPWVLTEFTFDEER